MTYPTLRRLPRFALGLVALASVAGSPLFSAPEIGPRSGKWAHEDSKLQPDPRVVWGRLDNGVRYALLPHHGVPGRVALRLIIHSGSLDETDAEQGMAHFTEHMCFRGTARFKYEEMISFFQKLGMEYGSDVNARTSFDSTTYMLDLRENDPDLIRQGLMLFRDFTDSVEFDAGYIEHERGVVLSEMRDRLGIASDEFDAFFKTALKGTLLAERSPIGKEHLLKTFTRQQFLDFYRRCYRPDLAVVVVAGDFDAEAMAGMISEEFSPIPARNDPITPRALGKISSRRGLRADILKISDIGALHATAISVVPPDGKPDSREARIEAFKQSFAFTLFNARMGNALYDLSEAGASTMNLVGYQISLAGGGSGPEEWDDAVIGIDEMIRATSERGFSAREIDRLRRDLQRRDELMLKQLPTMDPYALCQELVDSVTDHKVFIGVEADYRMHQEWLAKATAQDLQQSFRAAWPLDRLSYQLTGEVEIKGGEAKVVKVLEEARKSKVRTVRTEIRDESIVTVYPPGKPTPVVERKEVPELGAHLLRYGNNVHLNFVPREQEPGVVHIVIRVGNGLLDMPGKQPALKEFGIATLLGSGTTHYTPEQLGQVVSDHMLEFSIDMEDQDAFAIRGVVRTEDLPAFFSVATEFLHKPRFETYVHRGMKMKAIIMRALSSMGAAEGYRELMDHLFKGDPRFTFGTFNNYIGMSVLDVRNWLHPIFTKGFVEATVVGDVSEKDLLSLMDRTLAALPARAPTKTTAIPPEPVVVTAPPGFQRIEFVGEQHNAIVIGSWPVTEKLEPRDIIALYVLGKVLDIRIRDEVRDNLGLAYSPFTEFNEYDGFPDFGLFQTTITCAPPESTRVANMVSTLANEVSENGVTAGEFQGSLGIFKSQIRRSLLENSTIVELLKRAQERPASIDEALSIKGGLLDTVTHEEVDRWARTILPASNSRTAAIVPKPFVGIFQTGG